MCCQVVFNRAVIALGSDWGKELTGALSPFEFTGLRAPVPGKLRWVTTSIARFDPTNEWPSDLIFGVSVKNITTFDGSALTTSATVSYTTQPVAMRVRGVTSARAAALTDNQWSAQRGFWQGTDATSANDVEVPPDGVVTIDFLQGSYCDPDIYSYYNRYSCRDGKIDAQLVANALVFRKVGSSASIDVRSTVKACKYGGDHCISFMPPALESGAEYQLVLPKGSVYSPVAGVTQKDFVLRLFGLFPFELPFLQPRDLSSLASRRWSLYLRHGLANDTVCDALSCPAIASSLSLTDSTTNEVLPFQLKRVRAGELELYAPTASQSKIYQLRVTANAAIFDGFGLSLRAGSVSLPTAEASQMLAYNDANVFEKAFDGNLTFVHRMHGAQLPAKSGQCRQSVTRVLGTNVDASNVVDVISSLRSSVLYRGAVVQSLSDSTDGSSLASTIAARATPTSAPTLCRAPTSRSRCSARWRR
jgi:hypothetical protein